MHIRLPELVAVAFLAALTACRSTSPYQGMEAADLHALGQQEFEAGEYEDAQRALNRLFIAFPSYERTPEARLLLADSYFRDEQYITASSEYRRFVDRYPGHASAPVAGIGMCL